MKALIGIGAEDCPTKTCDNSKFIYFIGGWYNKTICNDDLTIRKTKDYVISKCEKDTNFVVRMVCEEETKKYMNQDL